MFLSRFVSKYTKISEESTFSGFYIMFLSLGNVILHFKNIDIDLESVLFGSDYVPGNFYILLIINLISLLIMKILQKGMIISTFENDFLSNTRPKSLTFFQKILLNQQFYSSIFYILLSINIIISFSIFGTLMSVGVMILPALIARITCKTINSIITMSILTSIFCQFIGLIISCNTLMPASSIIILILGIIYGILSVSKYIYIKLCR